MSDPAAAGTMVLAGDVGYSWPDGAPRFGQMVWGKVKSHPWWPGHVYSITLTDNVEVHRGHRDGLVLVAFFGDSSYGWFEPHEIVPFEEGFDDKAAEGLSTRGSFAAALAEAVDEVARRAALGLLCPCWNPGAFRPHSQDARYLLVDVPGFDPNADYHPDQIAAARGRFVPQKALDFLLDAAVRQRDTAEVAARTLPGMEIAGLLTAYRRKRYEPYDETYAEAFGADPARVRAAEAEEKAKRAERGINTCMLKRSSCAIDCYVIVVAVYLYLMSKLCYSDYCYRLSNNNCLHVNSRVDLFQIVSISLISNIMLQDNGSDSYRLYALVFNCLLRDLVQIVSLFAELLLLECCCIGYLGLTRRGIITL